MNGLHSIVPVMVLQLNSPSHDGTTHIVMSPLEFIQRLAALVPRPRLHLLRLPWRARTRREAASRDHSILGAPSRQRPFYEGPPIVKPRR